MFTAAATAAPLPGYAPIDTASGGMFTQTLGSSYFSGNGGASLYSGGFGGFGGSFGSSFGASNLGRGGYTGIGYATPFDPFGPAPTGYGMLPNAAPVFGAGAGAAPTPAIAPGTAPGGQVVYAHYAPNGTATTAGGAPAAPATPAPATAQAPNPADTKPKPDETKKDPKPEPKTVAVKSGDSLSKIAAAHGISWQKLYELNKGVIGANPNLIRPGQQLKLP